jgi:hypothetical protein
MILGFVAVAVAAVHVFTVNAPFVFNLNDILYNCAGDYLIFQGEFGSRDRSVRTQSCLQGDGNWVAYTAGTSATIWNSHTSGLVSFVEDSLLG